MCCDQIGGKALRLGGRGMGRKVTIPFEIRPEICRPCRGCDNVCPGVIVPCQGLTEPGELCGRCVRTENIPTVAKREPLAASANRTHCEKMGILIALETKSREILPLSSGQIERSVQFGRFLGQWIRVPLLWLYQYG
jgi:hypothetical protein